MKHVYALVLALVLAVPAMGQSATFLRPLYIDHSDATSVNAFRLTLESQAIDDYRYRVFSGSVFGFVLDAPTQSFISATSYASNPIIPGTPTTSTTWWIVYQRNTLNVTALRFRARRGPLYDTNTNSITVDAPNATIIGGIGTFFTISGTIDAANYGIILAFNASNELIAATGSNGNFALKIPNTETIARVEYRSINDVTFATRLGPFSSDTVLESALPVELTSFDVLARGSSAVLNWVTASETNNAGFAIEQRNGETWNTLGFVEGQGTTDRETSYAFTTEALTPGVHAFRLRQTDFDGTTSFSPIVEVAIVAEEDALTLVGANPFAGRTTARIAVTQPQAVTVELFDVTGRRVSTVFSGAVEAFQSIDVDGTSLAPGMYILRATGERFVQSRTLTVVR